MKSLTAVCAAGASMPAINASRRAIQRHQHPQRENAEMKMYLSKLKDLVPFMPKNRKLSKLEIIQHVIDYICDLQNELEGHPEIDSFDAQRALNFVAGSQNVLAMDADEDDDEAADEPQQSNGGGDGDEALDAQAEEDALMRRLSADAARQQNRRTQQQQQQQQRQQQLSSLQPTGRRQPLMDRQTPNTILPAAVVVSASASVAQQQLQPPTAAAAATFANSLSASSQAAGLASSN